MIDLVKSFKGAILKELSYVTDMLDRYNIPYEEETTIIEINWGEGMKKYPYTIVSIPEEINWKYRICFYSPLVNYGYGKAYSCSIRGEMSRSDVLPGKLERFVKEIELDKDEVKNMTLETDEMTLEIDEEDIMPEICTLDALIERFENEAFRSTWLSDDMRQRIKFKKYLARALTESYTSGRMEIREKNMGHNGYPYESPFV